MDRYPLDTSKRKNESFSPPSPLSNSGPREQWKIANSSRRRETKPFNNNPYHHTLPVSLTDSGPIQTHLLSTGDPLGRSQSPFSRLDRYKAKSPIIDKDRERSSTPQYTTIEEERMFDDEPLDESIEIAHNKNQPHSKKQSSKAVKTTVVKDYLPWTWWSGTAFFVTCCIPNWVLSTCGKKKSKLVQQAWREKVSSQPLIRINTKGNI